MWTTTDDRPGGRRPRPAHPMRAAALLAALFFWGFAAPPPAAAQEAESGQVEAPEPAQAEPAQAAPVEVPQVEAPDEPAPAAEASGLAATLGERYAASWSDDGVELTPRGEVAPGVRVVEVTEGAVRVNGDEVPENVLRSWFGDEAGPLLELAELDADEARGLLAVSEPVAEPAGEVAEVDAPEAAEEPEAPEEPERPRRRTGSILKFGSDVIVEEDEVADEAVSLGGDVIVHGRVRRDVVAVGGSIRVFGEIGGELTAVFGDVELGPGSEVDGNVMSVGGRVRRAPDAEVGGQIQEVSADGIDSGDVDWGDWVRHDTDGPFRPWKVDAVVWNLLSIALMALLACLTYLIGRRTVEEVAARLGAPMDVLIAFLVGLAAWLLIVPVSIIVCILIAITIVGCLLLPLVLIAEVVLVVIVFLVGYTAVALWAGRWIDRRFGRHFSGPYVTLVVGLLAIEIWHLVGAGFDVLSGPMQFFAWMFILAGTAVEFLAMTIGIGAVILNFFDNRRRRQAALAAGEASPEALPEGEAEATPPPPPADDGGPSEPEAPADDDFFDEGGDEAADDGDEGGEGGDDGADPDDGGKASG